MDAKYGNLTNMIRGLSEKHRAFLPGDGSRTASSSAERVEKWADGVNSQTPAEGDDIENDEDRKGHFDRPLRDIRVGESPSRPWGIHVPIPPAPAFESPTQSPAAPGVTADKPFDAATGPPKGGCPFGHGAGAPPPDHPAIETERVRNEEPAQTPDGTSMKDEKRTDDPPEAPAANIVFNGPVFFGFSAEKTAAFMQQLGSLGNNKT